MNERQANLKLHANRIRREIEELKTKLAEVERDIADDLKGIALLRDSVEYMRSDAQPLFMQFNKSDLESMLAEVEDNERIANAAREIDPESARFLNIGEIPNSFIMAIDELLDVIKETDVHQP